MVSTKELGGHREGRQEDHAAAPRRGAEGQVLSECTQPGASVASVAMSHSYRKQ